jgi:ABC-2 type transport system permease protein
MTGPLNAPAPLHHPRFEPGKAFEIARVNLLRQVRDRGDLFFVFVLPTIIVVALGLQFGGPSLVRLGVVAPTGDAAATSLVEALRSGDASVDVRFVADAGTLRSRVEHGQLEAGLVIPDGYAADLRGTGTLTLEFVGTTQALTRGVRAPVEAAVAKVAAVTTAARIAVAEGAGTVDAAASAAAGSYATVPGMTIQTTVVGEPGQFAGFSQFTFGASTQLIMFMFLTSLTAAGRLVHTRRLGVSRRMISTPTSIWTIVAGEALGRFAIALLQAGYIVLITAVAFGVSWGDPLAAAAIIGLFGVVAAGVAMLFGALASTPDQASSLGVFAGLAMGALGGCMIPFSVMPAAMQSVARLLPHSWAVLGIQSLIRDGGGLASVAPNLAVLAAWGVASMTLASWRFRKSIAG